MRSRRWLGKLAAALGALALGLVLLAGLEGVLRLAGLGAETDHASRLHYQGLVLPALVEGRLADGTEVWHTADPRLAYRTLPRQRAAGSLRVIAFGGSATAGLGYSPNAAFPACLERILSAALPGHEVEVLNLGIVAISSKQVQALVAEACERYEPDALVVYSGNNEFLEVHAAKYAAAHSSAFQRIGAALARTNLARLLRGAVSPAPDARSLAQWESSHEELRLTQEEIIRDVELEPSEIAAALDRYEANLEKMARAAQRRGVPLLLCSVASNWRWRGREDLPDGWIDELAGPAPGTPDERRQRARERLEEQLGTAAANQRSELLYRRAVLDEADGREADAAQDYRAALNADPHLRRALDAQNERVARVATREGTLYLDSVELLRSAAPDGIVGFGEFYDYVHFTPLGAWILAAGVFRALAAAGLFSPPADFDPDAIGRAQLRELEGRTVDWAEPDRWLGFSFDRGLLADRDLWKYERMLAGLDQRIERSPGDALAHVFRADARSFQLEGAAGATEDYRAALALDPGLAAARDGLARLQATRPR